MKYPIRALIFATCMLTLSACGAYVGDPPTSQVHETVTTRQSPPDEVHIYSRP